VYSDWVRIFDEQRDNNASQENTRTEGVSVEKVWHTFYITTSHIDSTPILLCAAPFLIQSLTLTQVSVLHRVG